MAELKPFRAIRPAQGLEDKIAALPYDVYSSAEAREVLKEEPMSFLRIDRAETQLPEGVDIYSSRVYQKAHDLLWDMVKQKAFIREEEPCYYIYELVSQGRVQDGFVACASIDDYVNGVIKKHENTRAEKEEDRIRHISACEAQTGPIFLAYRQRDSIRKLVDRVREEEPVYDFQTSDGVTHRVWIISDKKMISSITQAFDQMDHIYIADGHHRAASAVKVGLRKREEYPQYTGKEAFNYFLCVLFPDSQLKILDYNRVVRDLNGWSEEEFLKLLETRFEIEKSRQAVSPEEKGCFGMYLGDCWYRLRFKGADDLLSGKDAAVKALDVSILQDYVLNPILGIQDPKTDRRIDFIGGIRGLSELERRVKSGWEVAFSMYPTSMQELFAIADQGLLMPPKSTWFEPKLRSGLFIHALQDLTE